MPKRVSLKVPEIGFIAATRVAFGAGLAFLLSDKLKRGQRKKAGWALFTIGAATTVPIIVNVMRKARRSIGIAA
jgi:hypothetical protein